MQTRAMPGSFAKQLAGGLLDWSKQQSRNFDFAESLGAFRNDLKERHGKPGAISHKTAADDGGVGPAYIIYRKLSGDTPPRRSAGM
jgi:hypothetical protein